MVLLLLCAASAAAQVTDATVKGRVVDASGDILPGAVVTARHADTGIRRETTSDAAGTFLLAGLTPGVYSLGADVTGFRPFVKDGLRLTVGETADVTITLGLANVQESVEVTAGAVTVAVSREGRLSDTFGRTEVQNLPLPQRDVFLLPRMSAGAAFIPGAANSTKLTSSPVITVNGNRYRGNNYVLDGAMNTNPNNTGEPAIVPSARSGRGGAGPDAELRRRVRPRQRRGDQRADRVGHQRAARPRLGVLPQRRAERPQPLLVDHAAADVQPVRHQRWADRSSATRPSSSAPTRAPATQVERPFAFQVETPELRDYVLRTSPNSVAARAPARLPGADARSRQRRPLPRSARSGDAGRHHPGHRPRQRAHRRRRPLRSVLRPRRSRARHRRTACRRGGSASTSATRAAPAPRPATLGRALRGSRGPFDGFFGNLNVGAQQILGRAVNDARVSYQIINTTRGAADAIVPTVNITGITAPFGDVFESTTRLRTFELRDVLTLERGQHAIRVGGEVRRITKGLSIGPPTAGSFTFTTLASFVADRPFRQQLTVDPVSGEPTGFPRYFTQYESGLFIQDQWTISPRLSLSLGLRHDYFGTVTERGRPAVVDRPRPGRHLPASRSPARASAASIGSTSRRRLNFSPRIGLAWDPAGNGRMSIRSGFSLAYQPHHGQSISGARALPPDAIDGVIQPANGIGTQILYDIPVPYNPEFGRGLNDSGGVQSRPGEPPIRITGFVVNPTIKTQYTESWFLNGQRRLGQHWVVELGYVGTQGVNLERIDDVNRFTGDLLDGREDRLNPNFGVLLFVTNGVSSTYHAVHRRRSAASSPTASRCRPTTAGRAGSTRRRTRRPGQFQDNSEPGKGAQDIACLRCERAPSLFDVPHRFASALVYAAGGLRRARRPRRPRCCSAGRCRRS